jgi:membrane fusion protein, multidrug efflux system
MLACMLAQKRFQSLRQAYKLVLRRFAWGRQNDHSARFGMRSLMHSRPWLKDPVMVPVVRKHKAAFAGGLALILLVLAALAGQLPALPFGADKLVTGPLQALGLIKPPATASAPAANSPGQTQPGGGANQRPPVTVSLGKAARSAMPVRFDVIGTVQAMAAVTLRARVDSQILSVEFEDGAIVKKNDVLFKLDSRQIEAQIKQAEATLAKNKAQLALYELEVSRNEQLAQREATSQQRLDVARANVATQKAQIRGDEAALESLRIQRSYYDVVAPISGRVGVAGLKAGNIARQGDAAPPLATINQTSPIYVAFPVPQRLLPELRQAMTARSARVTAIPQGLEAGIEGTIEVLDNAIDTTTGTITARASFDNLSELLWPGILCNVRVTLRVDENAVSVPREAVQTGQRGTFVFTVENGVARQVPVTAERSIDGRTVILSGLKGDETIVTDGHSQLVNGARVVPAQAPAVPAAGQTARPGQG